jgi:hypothetical protein
LARYGLSSSKAWRADEVPLLATMIAASPMIPHRALREAASAWGFGRASCRLSLDHGTLEQGKAIVCQRCKQTREAAPSSRGCIGFARPAISGRLLLRLSRNLKRSRRTEYGRTTTSPRWSRTAMSGVHHVKSVAGASNTDRELSLMSAAEVKLGTGIGRAILRPRGHNASPRELRRGALQIWPDGGLAGRLPSGALFGGRQQR